MPNSGSEEEKVTSSSTELDGDEHAAEETASEAQESEAQESEAQESEAQESEAQESEAQDAEAQDAEAQDAEAQDAEAQDAEAQDAEAQDAEAQDAEAQDAEAQDAEAPSRLPVEESQAVVEALLYAAADPLSLRELKKAFPEAGDDLRPAIARLQQDYERVGHGLQIVEVAGGWQITTRPEYHEFVGRLFESPKPARLSLQALETLAVIAYRQPVTVPEIMELRGVRSAGVVRTLLEKKLVKIVGRKNVVGRPLLYGTTKEFLLRFGLKDLKDLPQLKDMSEVFGDDVAQQLEVLEAMDAAEAVSVEGSEEAPAGEPSEPRPDDEGSDAARSEDETPAGGDASEDDESQDDESQDDEEEEQGGDSGTDEPPEEQGGDSGTEPLEDRDAP